MLFVLYVLSNAKSLSRRYFRPLKYFTYVMTWWNTLVVLFVTKDIPDRILNHMILKLNELSHLWQFPVGKCAANHAPIFGHSYKRKLSWKLLKFNRFELVSFIRKKNKFWIFYLYKRWIYFKTCVIKWIFDIHVSILS